MAYIEPHRLHAALNTAVNALAVQLGDMYSAWRVHNVTGTKWEGVHRIEILINDRHYCLRGFAFVQGEYVIDIVLDAQSLYGYLLGKLDERLQSYTREHPWLLGV